MKMSTPAKAFPIKGLHLKKNSSQKALDEHLYKGLLTSSKFTTGSTSASSRPVIKKLNKRTISLL